MPLHQERVAPLALVLLLLAAGCTVSPAPLQTRSAEGSPFVAPPPLVSTLAFKACDELNLVFQVPADQLRLPPMFAPKRDATGRMVYLVLTMMGCKLLSAGRDNVSDPAGFFALVPVEPVAKVPIPGASSHQYLLAVASSAPRLEADFKGLVAEVDNHTVEVTFVDGPPWPKNSAQAVLRRGDTILLSAQSLTAGPLRVGASGSLGVYMVRDDVVTTAEVRFSNYTFYANGQATFDPGDGTPRALAHEGRILTNVNHNLGYDLEFRINRTAHRWP